MNWRGKAHFIELSKELEQLENYAFTQQILRYVRLYSPHAQETLPLGSLDRNGIDIILPSNVQDTWETAIQCKGFKKSEELIDKSHTALCIKSIRSFAEGGVRANEYVIVHNRENVPSSFREAVEAKLNELVASGRVPIARLLSRNTFLSETFTKFFEIFRAHTLKKSTDLRKQISWGESAELVSDIPFNFRFGKISTSGISFEANSIYSLTDPTSHFSSDPHNKRPELTFVLGEFGMGKTTLAYRASALSSKSTIYVPATAFPRTAAHSREILGHLCYLEEFCDTILTTSKGGFIRTALWPLSLMMAVKLFSQAENGFHLIIDGLDESPLLSTGLGLPVLLSAISKFQVRTTLIMRTEFWNHNKEHILSGYRGRQPRGKTSPPNRKFQFLTLCRWKEEQMATFVQMAVRRETEKLRERNLTNLLAIITNGEYLGLFGDIPMRPLFLQMLIDYAAEFGISNISLTMLFEIWVHLKIRRDIVNSKSDDGVGRIGITETEQNADAIMRLATRAMKRAAVLMTEDSGGQLIMISECQYEVLSTAVLNNCENPTGLTLNSLLYIDAFDGSGNSVKFAHRAFQEYFLALAIRDGLLKTESLLPVEVRIWLQRLGDGESL